MKYKTYKIRHTMYNVQIQIQIRNTQNTQNTGSQKKGFERKSRKRKRATIDGVGFLKDYILARSKRRQSKNERKKKKTKKEGGRESRQDQDEPETKRRRDESGRRKGNDKSNS